MPESTARTATICWRHFDLKNDFKFEITDEHINQGFFGQLKKDVVPSQNLPEDAIVVEPMSDFNPVQTSPAETSTAETSPAETSPAEKSPDQPDQVQISPAETISAETSPAETISAETSPAQTSPAHTSSAQSLEPIEVIEIVIDVSCSSPSTSGSGLLCSTSPSPSLIVQNEGSNFEHNYTPLHGNKIGNLTDKDKDALILKLKRQNQLLKNQNNSLRSGKLPLAVKKRAATDLLKGKFTPTRIEQFLKPKKTVGIGKGKYRGPRFSNPCYADWRDALLFRQKVGRKGYEEARKSQHLPFPGNSTLNAKFR